MRLRRGGLEATLTDDGQAVTFDNQGVAAAAVAFTEHAGVDLDDLAI
jgi:hypothetical protein